MRRQHNKKRIALADGPRPEIGERKARGPPFCAPQELDGYSATWPLHLMRHLVYYKPSGRAGALTTGYIRTQRDVDSRECLYPGEFIS
jgi:hypothetical protein